MGKMTKTLQVGDRVKIATNFCTREGTIKSVGCSFDYTTTPPTPYPTEIELFDDDGYVYYWKKDGDGGTVALVTREVKQC